MNNRKKGKKRKLKAENPHRQRETQHFLDEFWIFHRTHTAHEPHFLLVQVSVFQQVHYRLKCRFVSYPKYCAVNCRPQIRGDRGFAFTVRFKALLSLGHRLRVTTSAHAS